MALSRDNENPTRSGDATISKKWQHIIIGVYSVIFAMLCPAGAIANVYVSSDLCTPSPPPYKCYIYVIDSSGSTVGTFLAGNTPIGVALSPDAAHVYVANEGDNTIQGFSLPSTSLSWTTPVPAGSTPQYIAVSPNGAQLWVSNYNHTVSVLNAMGGLVTTLTLTDRPGHIAFTKDGKLAYVVIGDGHLAIYSTGATPTLQFNLSIPVNASGIAVTPNGHFAYIAAEGSGGNGSISIISIPANPATMPTLLPKSITGPTPFNPYESVVVSPDGSHLYFNDEMNLKLYEASTATNTITRSTGGLGGALSLSPDGQFLYSADGKYYIEKVSTVSFSTTVINVTTGHPGFYTFGVAASSTPPTVASVSYVPNQGSDSVSVISNSSRAVIKTIPLASGSAPTGVAVSPDLNEVYIADYGTGNISIIDATTNTLEPTSIPLGTGTEPFSIAFTPNGDYAYVTESGANKVVEINTNTLAVTPVTGPIGTEPVGVAVTPDGSKAYVINYFSGSVSVINTATNVAASPITSNIGTLPAGIAISPDGLNAYIANQSSDNVSKLPIGSTSATLIPFSSGSHPFGVAISPDSTKAYVTDNGTGQVSVITLGSSPTVTTPLSASYPLGIALSPDGTEVYFANNNSSGSIGVANTASNTNLTAIGVGRNPQSLGLFVRRIPNPNVAYVANQTSNSVSVIDTTDDAVLATINLGVGTSPIGTAFSPDRTKVCVAEYGSSQVAIIDASSNTVPTGNQVTLPGASNTEPFGVAFTPDSKYCYVTESAANQVVAIDTTASPPDVVATISLNIGNEPVGIAITPDGTMAYVTNYGSGSVSPITIATNTAAAPITSGIGSLPAGIAISPDGLNAYIANQSSDSVSKLPIGSTAATLIPFTSGTHPFGIVITPDNTMAYVTDNGTGQISVIALGSTPTVTTPLSASYPLGIGITPDGTRVYFANSGNATLGVIDTRTNAVIDSIPVGASPQGFGMFIQ